MKLNTIYRTCFSIWKPILYISFVLLWFFSLSSSNESLVFWDVLNWFFPIKQTIVVALYFFSLSKIRKYMEIHDQIDKAFLNSILYLVVYPITLIILMEALVGAFILHVGNALCSIPETISIVCLALTQVIKQLERQATL